ncbi:MAG: LysR family transcriptional regulator [Kofleriaceae bacterium]
MQRAVRVSMLWSWLPAFRTVAETEHLPTAAAMLELSPSALSRSVKQLEDSLGQPLFTRDGRRMRLNRAGELLLIAVRDAMRRIDDGIDQASAPSRDRIRIAGSPEWLQLLVLPAIHAREPDEAPIVVEVEEVAPAELAHALLRGEIDLAVCDALEAHEQLRVERLGEVRRAVCWSAEIASDDGLEVAAWVTGHGDEVADRDRGHTGLRTSSLALVIEACRTGRVRAVLPVVLARANGLQVRLDDALRISQLDLVQRQPLTDAPIAPIVGRIKARARELFGG